MLGPRGSLLTRVSCVGDSTTLAPNGYHSGDLGDGNSKSNQASCEFHHVSSRRYLSFEAATFYIELKAGEVCRVFLAVQLSGPVFVRRYSDFSAVNMIQLGKGNLVYTERRT